MNFKSVDERVLKVALHPFITIGANEFDIAIYGMSGNEQKILQKYYQVCKIYV